MATHTCCQCESQRELGWNRPLLAGGSGNPCGAPLGTVSTSRALRAQLVSQGCGPSRNRDGSSRTSWGQRAAELWALGREAGPPELWSCPHRNAGRRVEFENISLDTEGGSGGCQMLVCGCWAMPLPCLSTGTSVPPGLPREVPRGAGNAAPRLEYSWSVVGLTLKVISPPDRGLPGATGHCQSAVGGPKAAVWIRARWAEFPFPPGSGGGSG